jgi:hypothetical protein
MCQNYSSLPDACAPPEYCDLDNSNIDNTKFYNAIMLPVNFFVEALYQADTAVQMEMRELN